MQLISLTHANHGRAVNISPAHVAAVYVGSDASTHIILVGAIIPVKESQDEVIRLLTASTTLVNNGGQDGIKTSK